MADLNIVKNAAYDRKVQALQLLRQDLIDRRPLLRRLAERGDHATIRAWRQDDELLDEMIKFIRRGHRMFKDMGSFADD